MVFVAAKHQQVAPEHQHDENEHRGLAGDPEQWEQKDGQER